MSEEWSAWIEHDGKGCPCVGHVVQVERMTGEIEGPFVAGAASIAAFGSANTPGSAWVHVRRIGFRDDDWIARYRIRKPRGMTILEGLLESLPEKVDA